MTASKRTAKGSGVPTTRKSAPRSRQRAAEKQGPAPVSPWVATIGTLADSALRMAGVGRDAAARVPVRTPEQLRMMAMAGDSLRDVRQVAGLTASDIARALDLRDKSVWEAVEDGREVLSMELILRLASLLARNDPLPFVLRMARSYQPRLWAVLEELGVDALPLQLERERDFINIFRRHDAARALPDADWARLLAFTRQAFEMGLGLMENDPNTATGESSPAPAEARRRKRRSPK